MSLRVQQIMSNLWMEASLNHQCRKLTYCNKLTNLNESGTPLLLDMMKLPACNPLIWIFRVVSHTLTTVLRRIPVHVFPSLASRNNSKPLAQLPVQPVSQTSSSFLFVLSLLVRLWSVQDPCIVIHSDDTLGDPGHWTSSSSEHLWYM